MSINNSDINKEKSNILYVSSNYFSYNRAISKQLRLHGYDVTDAEFDNKDPGFLRRKVYEKKGINYPKQIKEKYLNEILMPALTAKKYDVVLVSQISLDKEWILKIKSICKGAIFIRVLMDDMTFSSEEENSNLSFFDVVTTYYREDADKYGFIYNPNFYDEQYTNEKKYDWSFIGTAPSKRREILSEILKQCSKNFYMHIYVGAGSGLKDIINHEVLKNPGKNGVEKYLRSSSVTPDKTCDIFSKSRCILDINHPWQKGLSFRPFHAMAMHTKLITTNRDIVNYDFYNADNIWVMDYDNPVMPGEDFIRGEYKELPSKVFEYYSIESWCRRLEETFGSRVGE